MPRCKEQPKGTTHKKTKQNKTKQNKTKQQKQNYYLDALFFFE
jgi:hypothetical protein